MGPVELSLHPGGAFFLFCVLTDIFYDLIIALKKIFLQAKPVFTVQSRIQVHEQLPIEHNLHYSVKN